MTSPLQLAAEVLRLEALATKGEWSAHDEESGRKADDPEKAYRWCFRSADGHRLIGHVYQHMTADGTGEANAAFIALSRTAAPLLAQRVIELEKAVREWAEAHAYQYTAYTLVLRHLPEGPERTAAKAAVTERLRAAEAALRSLLADAGGEATTEATFPVVVGDVPPWFPPLSMAWVCACGERGDGVASNIAHAKEAHGWDGSPRTAHILDSPPDWYVALLAKEAKAKNGETPQEPSR